MTTQQQLRHGDPRPTSSSSPFSRCRWDETLGDRETAPGFRATECRPHVRCCASCVWVFRNLIGEPRLNISSVSFFRSPIELINLKDTFRHRNANMEVTRTQVMSVVLKSMKLHRLEILLSGAWIPA